MSRASTVLVVALVVVIVAAAAADAVWNRGDERETPVQQRAERGMAAQLRAAGIAGALVYTDDRDCELVALRLPSLERAAVPAGPPVGCAFSASRRARRVAAEGARWMPDGAFAICRGRTTDVVIPPAGRPRHRFDGCAPGVRPGARPTPWTWTLTVARGGALVEVRPACERQPPCERVVLPRAAVLAAALRHPNASDNPDDRRFLLDVAIESAAWLSATRVAVLVRLVRRRRNPEELLAVFERDRLLAIQAVFDDRLRRVEPSPDALYVFVEPDLLVRDDGTLVSLPAAFGRVRAGAWSPDSRWLALAVEGGVVFVDVDSLERYDEHGGSVPSVVVPLRAADLAWR